MSWRMWAGSKSSSRVQKVKVHKEGKQAEHSWEKEHLHFSSPVSAPVIPSTFLFWWSVLFPQCFLYQLPLINRSYLRVQLPAIHDYSQIWASCLGCSPLCNPAPREERAISWLSVFSHLGLLSTHEQWPLNCFRNSSNRTIILPGIRIQNLENNLYFFSFLPTQFFRYSWVDKWYYYSPWHFPFLKPLMNSLLS